MAQPVIDPLPSVQGRPRYILRVTYPYEWGNKGVYQRIRIPAGFIYDGASVPRWAYSVSGILPDGPHRAGVLIHDALYRYKGILPTGWHEYFEGGKWRPVLMEWRRRDADRLFARIMRDAHYSKSKRRMAYRCVRLGGRRYWH